MGTKNKPGDFDCYHAAHPDEPMFILLARDPLAPGIVELWADQREQGRGPSAKVEEARRCVKDMQAWQTAHAPPTPPVDPLTLQRYRHSDAVTLWQEAGESGPCPRFADFAEKAPLTSEPAYRVCSLCGTDDGDIEYDVAHKANQCVGYKSCCERRGLGCRVVRSADPDRTCSFGTYKCMAQHEVNSDEAAIRNALASAAAASEPGAPALPHQIAQWVVDAMVPLLAKARQAIRLAPTESKSHDGSGVESLTDAPRVIGPATLKEVLEQTKNWTLLDALVHVAIWENDRAVKQALRGERDPHTGALWETCFCTCFEGVLERHKHEKARP